MKVAIITRTKDRPVLLQRAIESVLVQTYFDYIHVIVNDGGAPEPVDRLVSAASARYRERVRVIHNPTSIGMEGASNTGIQAVDSEYVVIHDDDDSWAPTFLAESVAHLEAPDLPRTVQGVVCFCYRIVERVEGNRVIEVSRDEFNSWQKHITLFRIAGGNTFPPICFLFRRQVFAKIGYYDASLPVLGDWEFNLRFLSEYDIDVLPCHLANYHHRINDQISAYGNSVIAGVDKHQRYRTLIVNNLLRKDLHNGSLGLGYLVNQNTEIVQMALKINRLNDVLNRVFNIPGLRQLKFLLKKR